MVSEGSDIVTNNARGPFVKQCGVSRIGKTENDEPTLHPAN